MRPPSANKSGEVAAFISNCAAKSFRLEALEELSKGLGVHSYGRCMNNAHATASKSETLIQYKFTLAFENSQVWDLKYF